MIERRNFQDVEADVLIFTEGYSVIAQVFFLRPVITSPPASKSLACIQRKLRELGRICAFLGRHRMRACGQQVSPRRFNVVLHLIGKRKNSTQAKVLLSER